MPSKMRKPTTREMSDAHEQFIVEQFGGTIQRGSGNQFNRQMDVIQSPQGFYPMAFDGKSTLGQSISVSREMWGKAIQQSHGLTPALPLRFYDTWNLHPGLDLVVVSADTLAELHNYARWFHEDAT